MKNQIERAEPSRGAPHAALQALRQWEADTEAPARANEGNAFIDGFQAGRAGHVVLLEALKKLREWDKKWPKRAYIVEYGMISQSERELNEICELAEAAIEQAERQ